jgi:hypothetical protein
LSFANREEGNGMMKKLLTGFYFILAMGTAALAFAQTKPDHVLFEKGQPHSSTHTFNLQLIKTRDQIRKDVKTGALTQSQAQVLMGKVKAIRVQELQMMKENPGKDLTASQTNQVTQKLNNLQSGL